MPRYAFIANFAGRYIPKVDGDDVDEVLGVSLFLGVESGDNPEDAFSRLYGKHSMDRVYPDILKLNVFCYEVGQFIDVNIKKAISVDKEDIVIDTLQCRWCDANISNKGAAQFSHLQKHLRVLLKKKLITKEQFQAVRSIELSKEIDDALTLLYKKKVNANIK